MLLAFFDGETEANNMERWCLCNNCLAAIKSRGERVLSRSMEFEDMTDEEAENDEVMCDWCEEMFCESEMNICE